MSTRRQAPQEKGKPVNDDYDTRKNWSPWEWETAAAVTTDEARAERMLEIAESLRLHGARSFSELYPEALPEGVANVDPATQARVDLMRWDAEMRIDQADKEALRQAANAARDRLGVPRLPRTSLDD
jgi:hypothetical protein